jgi:hypothetical protein
MASDYDKPYALVLKYYYYLNSQRIDECESLIEELERFSENSAVAGVLFRHYGRSLHSPNNRVRFWDFVRQHPEVEDKHDIRFNFYLSIINAYDKRFNDSRKDIRKITDRYRYFNRSFEQTWRNADDGEPTQFEGIVEAHGNRKFVHIFDLQYSVPLGHRRISETIKKDDRGLFVLKFFPYGIIGFPLQIVKGA